MAKPTFIIEHAEPEMYEWCVIENEQMANYVKKDQLWFTNMPQILPQLKDVGSQYTQSFTKLGLDAKKICILDPAAKETLSAKDTQAFDYFVFGGILGDKEFDGRTGKLVTAQLAGVSTRNMGTNHFATDTAVLVATLLLSGKKLSDIRFANEVEIEINENECVSLPFYYAIIDGKAMISEKLIEHLRKREEF
ncbi:MAG TPA: RNA methyltransferase [Acidobacteriota bacterium]|nr:RNA methyltransferase [Acidobacteriota bacterium]